MFGCDGSRLPFQPLALALRWGTIAPATVGTRLVILPTIACEHRARLGHGVEDVPRHPCVAPGAVAALSVPMLPGTAGVEIQRAHLGRYQPRAHGQGHACWAMIAPDDRRGTLDGPQPLQDRSPT